MPLWNVYHPIGAYTREDKYPFAKRLTEIYSYLLKFYVDFVFQKVSQNSFYVGGGRHRILLGSIWIILRAS
jgi:phenylpyruvate tautomerase PptA (4-oxalocrotonate tautomerase family)